MSSDRGLACREGASARGREGGEDKHGLAQLLKTPSSAGLGRQVEPGAVLMLILAQIFTRMLAQSTYESLSARGV